MIDWLRESSTDRAIDRDGYALGVAEVRPKCRLHFFRAWGRMIMGDPSAEVLARLRALTDQERLKAFERIIRKDCHGLTGDGTSCLDHRRPGRI